MMPISTGQIVLIRFHHDQMRRGKTVMRVHCCYLFDSHEEAALWGLENIAAGAPWTIEPLLDPALAVPRPLPRRPND